MDNLYSVHSFKHGAAVFGIAALVGAIAAVAWHFLSSPVSSVGSKVAGKA